MNNAARQYGQRHHYYRVGRRLAQWVRIANATQQRKGRVPAPIARKVAYWRAALTEAQRIR